MALALETLKFKVGGMLDDILAVGNGLIDWHLLGWDALAFIVKNLVVVLVDKAGIMKLPAGLVYSSEYALGLVVGALLS